MVRGERSEEAIDSFVTQKSQSTNVVEIPVVCTYYIIIINKSNGLKFGIHFTFYLIQTKLTLYKMEAERRMRGERTPDSEIRIDVRLWPGTGLTGTERPGFRSFGSNREDAVER